MRITDDQLAAMADTAAAGSARDYWEDGIAQRVKYNAVWRRAFAAAIAKDIMEIVSSHASVEGIAQRIEADIKERYGVE